MTITLYFIALIIMGIIDSVWLFSMGAQYKAWLGHIFAPTFFFTPAVIFYLIYAAGLVYFVISPAIQQGQQYLHIFLTGAFLGLLAYAAYDLTNHATLQNWPLAMTIVDMAWGALLSGLVSLLTVIIYTQFIR
ncbi:MAG: hypothetical protein RLY57_61 [Candidatus Parcubacteria bacterium]|jgi:uncharacterized membrane protein